MNYVVSLVLLSLFSTFLPPQVLHSDIPGYTAPFDMIIEDLRWATMETLLTSKAGSRPDSNFLKSRQGAPHSTLNIFLKYICENIKITLKIKYRIKNLKKSPSEREDSVAYKDLHEKNINLERYLLDITPSILAENFMLILSKSNNIFIQKYRILK